MNLFKAMITLLSALFVFTGSECLAQQFDYWAVPVEEDGKVLPLAGTGGFNVPQFSDVDLNNDGVEDLYVFDRTANTHTALINEGVPGAPKYVFRPEFTSGFPDSLNEFVLLRDYNCDGVMDIFTQSHNPAAKGIHVYTGRFEGNQMRFEIVKFTNNDLDLIFVPAGNGDTNLYVAVSDVPAIDDIDGDGDLDILTFDIGGSIISFYKNMEKENNLPKGSLQFRRTDRCWGKFTETGITNTLVLSDNPNTCSSGLLGRVASSRHAGSTILTFDEDGDGDKDILLGDISFDNLVFGRNNYNRDTAWVTEVDTVFPSYDNPVDLPVFPASFYVDIDKDGNRDLVASPNELFGEDRNNVWYYRNTNTDSNPTFSLESENELVRDMVDLGKGAIPVFVDYNADGLMDVVVGNSGLFEATGQDKVFLQLYLNIGSRGNPVFRLEDDDLLNFSNEVGDNNTNLAPAFGDLDNDGDLDLLVGESIGKLFYAENLAGAGQPMRFGTVTYNYANLDPGQNSVPEIYDVNNDGLNDLIVGEKNGNVNYYQNQGTMTVPSFQSDHKLAPNSEFVGLIDVRKINKVTGASSPKLLMIGDELNFFVSSESGQVWRYNQINTNNISDPFNIVSESVGELNRYGARSNIDFADLNNDGKLDAVVGNIRGGITFFQTDISSGIVNTNEVDADLLFSVFPNPTRDYLEVVLPADKSRNYRLRLYNKLGQLIQVHEFNDTRKTLDVSNLAAGVYHLEIEQGNSRGVQRVVKF